MKPKHLFAAITKVDAATRTVTGIAMQEILDRSGEVCLYAESKPYFEAWSENQNKASGGKSKGNLREMHASSAVGIILELDCVDAEKAFVIKAEVVDDDAWKKVEKGVYTGFSIGANFATKPTLEKGVLYWVADPVEISLVDVPCVPTATFDLTKADGSTEKRKFISSRKTLTAAQQKSMYSVSEMAYALSSIGWLVQDLEYEALYEGDDSQIPARMRAWLESGCEIFLDLTEEETSEFAQMITAQKAARAADRAKAAPTPTTQHQQEQNEMTPEQQKAFDAAVEKMTAAAAVIDQLKSVPDTLKTISDAQTAQNAEIAQLKTQMGEMQDLKAGLEQLEKAFSEQPEPAKTKSAAAVAVPREKDGAGAEPDALKGIPTDGTATPEQRREAMKALHAQGGQPGSGFIG